MCCVTFIYFVTCYYICSFVNGDKNHNEQKPETDIQKKLEDVVLIIEQQQVAIRNLEQNQRKLLDNVVKLKRTNKRLLSLVQGRCSLYQTCNQIYGVYAKDDKQMARGNIKNGVENSQPCNAGSCNCKTKISEKDDDLQKRLLVNVASANTVAFSLALSHQLTLGPNQAVQYDKIITNIGNAYNPNHGHIIVPISGIYILSVTCFNQPQDDDRLEIVKNGDLVTSLYTQGSGTYSSMSQTVVISLETGDVLWIRMYNKQNYSGHHLYGTATEYYNTFSGILIFPL